MKTSKIQTGLIFLITIFIILSGCDFKVKPTLPMPPTGLEIVQVTETTIRLIWKDNAKNEDGFKIYRGLQETDLILVDIVGTNVTTYTDTNLEPEIRYFYKVTAFNSTGESGISNTNSAQTNKARVTVTGQLVDLRGKPIEGVWLSINTLKAESEVAGWFTFPHLVADNYLLHGKGGRHHHYLINPTEIELEKVDKDIGAIVGYRIFGCGIVMQTLGEDGLAANSTPLLRTLDKWDFWMDEMIHHTLHPDSISPINQQSLSQSSGLTDDLAFFLLRWEPIEGVEQYQIFFIDSEKTEGRLVWDSFDQHPEDPLFDPSNPEAYLDLGQELEQIIVGPGIFTFKVTGLTGSGEVVLDLPHLTVPLGQHLRKYPTNLRLIDDLLLWDEVNGASGYRVQIYTQGNERVYDSGRDLLRSTSLQLPSDLAQGEYYTWKVDAHGLDETGWTAEITRGISGFIF